MYQIIDKEGWDAEWPNGYHSETYYQDAKDAERRLRNLTEGNRNDLCIVIVNSIVDSTPTHKNYPTWCSFKEDYELPALCYDYTVCGQCSYMIAFKKKHPPK